MRYSLVLGRGDVLWKRESLRKSVAAPDLMLMNLITKYNLP